MYRAILLIITIVILGGALPVHCQEPASGGTLTLEQAIKDALENNRSAQNARIEVDKSTDRLDAFRTHRLPQFKLTAQGTQPLNTFDTTFEAGVFGTYNGIGAVPATDTVVTSSRKFTALVLAQVSQPVTQLFQINLQLKQMQAGRDVSREQARAKEQQVVNDVKRAYYAILQSQGAISAAEATVKLYREVDRVTADFVVQEAALKTDQMQVQTRLAKAEFDVMSLNDTLASQKEKLNLLLGRDVGTDFTVSDGLEASQTMIRETDLNQARARALQQRPELHQAQLQVEQAKLDKRIKKADYLPDVSLTFNYISSGGYSDFVPRSVTNVGIQVDWEVFDWGRKKRELKEKERSIAQADNTLKETESQIVMEINQRYRSLQEACQQVRIARMSQNTERANVQLVAYKYRADALLLKDVLQAETSLANANYDFQKALLTFWTAKADFEKALGEDK